jgi:hypothetical protein
MGLTQSTSLLIKQNISKDFSSLGSGIKYRNNLMKRINGSIESSINDLEILKSRTQNASNFKIDSLKKLYDLRKEKIGKECSTRYNLRSSEVIQKYNEAQISEFKQIDNQLNREIAHVNKELNLVLDGIKKEEEHLISVQDINKKMIVRTSEDDKHLQSIGENVTNIFKHTFQDTI